MSRYWNCKKMLDRALDEGWSSSTNSTMLARAIRWGNEIQNDIVKSLPYDAFNFKLKKLIPASQEFIDLAIDIPAAPSTALGGGGALTETNTYKPYITFVIYDPDTKKYMESEPSPAGTGVLMTSGNLTLLVTDIPTFDGDDSYEPKIIYRNVYVAELAAGETVYGPAYYSSQITNNGDTTASVAAVPASTAPTPPSSSEIDQISSDHMYFPESAVFLDRRNNNRTRRYDVASSEGTPRSFDWHGLEGISIYPQVSSGATDKARTMLYSVHRRPHEMFYNIEREMDLPIQCEAAWMKGMLWKMYEFRDRSGAESKQKNYDEEKKELEKVLGRNRGRPSVVRDVVGDYAGYEV